MMGRGQRRDRDYSPGTVERLREDSVPAEEFDALIEAAPASDAVASARSRGEAREEIDGLADEDMNELAARKERAAEARYRAKARGGRLVFR